MDRKQCRDRLELDDDSILDEKVDAIPEVNAKPVIDDWDENLRSHLEFAFAKLMDEAPVICPLQESRP
jgi:hypothetical protein